MKKLTMVFVCGIVLSSGMSVMAGSSCCPSAKKETTTKKVAQTTCPVMGGKIDKNLFVDVKGKRIYICCKACVKPLEKDPDKYIKKLEDAGVLIEKTPVANKKK